MRKLNIILALIVACLMPCPILAFINLEWALEYFVALVVTIIGVFAVLVINALSKNQMEDFETAKRNLKNSQRRPQFEVRISANKEDAIKAQKEGFEIHEIRLSGDTWMCAYCQTINSSEKAFCVNCGASRKEE